MGNNQQGLAMLDNAMKMKGTERMLDNARVCRWVSSMNDADGSAKYQEYFLNELKWIQTVEKKEISTYGGNLNVYGNFSDHYTEVLQNVMYDIMPAKAQQWGKTNLATAMVGWMNHHEQELSNNNEEVWISNDYKYALDSLTANEMIQYRDYLHNPRQGSELERYLNTGAGSEMGEDYFNDRIGTKYIREGKFEEAIPYLEKVSLSYIGTQAVSFYMARRSYNEDRWFRNQVVCHSEYWDCDETPTPVKYNQKLNFCRDMVMLKNTIANPEPEDENDIISVPQLKYKMASILYQASYKGQCWYISRYGQSCYDEVCYKDELDFVAEAVRLLDEAVAEADDLSLKQNALYARAYIPFGSRFHTQTWDEEYNVTDHYDKQSREYQTMNQLATFVMNNRSQISSNILRCDVLKQFQRGTFKGHWPSD